MKRARKIVLAGLASAFLALFMADAAAAAWNANGGGDGSSKARSLSTMAAPSVSASGRNVTVGWTAPGGGAPVGGYVVRRYNTSNVVQTIGAACSGTVAGTSCVEAAVPAGTWKYTVTAARANWRGTESPFSPTVAIAGPALTLSPTTINSFPTVLTGSISGYSTGQTVVYRLDNPVSGTVLSGSIVPSPVPTNGAATASVTIPAGTSNGPHTIYAVGSGGDQASQSITVNAPKVTGSVIAKSAGGDPSFIRQAGTYFVYANVSGSGGPPAGLSTLRANVANVTTGQTAAPLTFGSFTVNGVAYNYRSASLTASNPLTEGAKAYSLNLTDTGGTSEVSNFSVTVDNTTPTAAAVETTNVSGGTAGRAELGDTMTLTYSEVIDANSVLAGWTGPTQNVVVRLNNAGGGDTVTIFNSTNSTQLRVGTVSLASTGYTTANRTFGLTGTPSTITRSGGALTVVLGTASGAVTTAPAASSMIWTPVNTATDRAGNAASTTARTEAPPADLNF